MCLKHYNLCAKLWSQNHNSTEQTSWWTTTWRVHNGVSLNCAQHIHKTKHYWKKIIINLTTTQKIKCVACLFMWWINEQFQWWIYHSNDLVLSDIFVVKFVNHLEGQCKMSWNDLKLFSLSQCCQNKHKKRNTTGYYLTHDKNLKNCTPLHVRSTRCLRSHWSFNRCAILASATPTAFRQR